MATSTSHPWGMNDTSRCARYEPGAGDAREWPPARHSPEEYMLFNVLRHPGMGWGSAEIRDRVSHWHSLRGVVVKMRIRSCCIGYSPSPTLREDSCSKIEPKRALPKLRENIQFTPDPQSDTDGRGNAPNINMTLTYLIMETHG